jgi:hypothetical protein
VRRSGAITDVRNLWYVVLFIGAVAVITRNFPLVATAGALLTVWSLAVVANWKGLATAHEERGRTRPMFGALLSSYRLVGCVGVLIGVAWFVIGVIKSF